jgi:hypothetical protein
MAVTVFYTLDNDGEPRGFAQASKSDALMDAMREELPRLIIGLSSIYFVGEKQYAVTGIMRLQRMNTKLSPVSRVPWWYKDIPRNKE